jgi:hypothetical protein
VIFTGVTHKYLGHPTTSKYRKCGATNLHAFYLNLGGPRMRSLASTHPLSLARWVDYIPRYSSSHP